MMYGVDERDERPTDPSSSVVFFWSFGLDLATDRARPRSNARALNRARRVVRRSMRAALAVVCSCAFVVDAVSASWSASTRARANGAVTQTYGARRGASRLSRAASSASVGSSNMSDRPSAIVVEPRDGAANGAFIMLHGLGDTGRGWASAAQQIRAPRGTRMRWIFPTARTVPVTLNGGMRMTAWFDLNALDEASIVDDRGMIDESAAYVDALVREQMAKGIPSEKIIVGGFSQGGVIALTSALRSQVKLGGCVALSTYLALRDDYPGAFGPHAKELKIFQAHGTHDFVLQYAYGKMSAEYLRSLNVSVDFKTYSGMQHSACAEEFDDLADFLDVALS